MLLAAVLTGCSPTKHVPTGERLLDKVHVEGDLGNASLSDLEGYVRQQPNYRFLHLWRVGLCVYSLSKVHDPSRFGMRLRAIGSEPVLFDTLGMQRSAEQLRLFMVSRGYYDCTVVDSVHPTRDKRCETYYHLEAGRPYKIASLGYSVPQGEVGSLVLADTAGTLLHVGDNFDSNIHDQERQRISRMLQDRGYYGFNSDYVYFLADSSGLDHLVRDSLIVTDALGGPDLQTPVPHKKAVVDEVNLVVLPSTERNTRTAKVDSTLYTTMDIRHGLKATFRTERDISEGRRRAQRTGQDASPFTSKFYSRSCLLDPDSLYQISRVDMSQMRYSSLKTLRHAAFYFNPDTAAWAQADTMLHLKALGFLSMNKTQTFGVEVEGTNSSGNLGAAGSVKYTHNNIFRGAEAFSIKARVGGQAQTASEGKGSFFTLELGLEAQLTLPLMLFPAHSRHFYERHNPKTLFSLSYDLQRRPEFYKSSIAARMSYTWLGSKYSTLALTPVEFNVVSIPYISDNFRDYIRGTYLQWAYTDHFIMSLGFNFVFNKQREVGRGVYARFNAETAGNFLRLCTLNQSYSDFRRIWNIRYSQYVRFEGEGRYMLKARNRCVLATRLFAGIGIPYGNSVMLPFEKSFFVGGANSVRAWPVRGLGPGAKPVDENLRYHNQIGDLRLEANAEYRFPIFSVLEGAVFADAGNVWTLSAKHSDALSAFSKRWAKQIALGAGLGVRLNFDYFVFRVDAAYKLHDPSAADPWWPEHKRFQGSEIAWNFAIGYPF